VNMRIYDLVSLIAFGFVTPIQWLDAAEFESIGQFPEGNFGSTVKSLSSNGEYVAGNGLRYPFASVFGGDAFLWNTRSGLNSLTKPTVPKELPTFPFSAIASSAISQDGNAVSVNYATFDDAGFRMKGARWNQAHGLTFLKDVPGGTSNYATNGISPDGEVSVGYATTNVGRSAVMWRAGEEPYVLGNLPGGVTSSEARAASYDASVIIGMANSSQGIEAFRWTASTGIVGLGDLPGGAYGTFANDVSHNGDVVVGAGYSAASNLSIEAFQWTADAGFLMLGSIASGEFRSDANAVSGNGQIIVGSTGSQDNKLAFIWSEQSGMVDLREALVSQGLASELQGWDLISASDISYDGSIIIGNGVNSNGIREGWVARIDLNALTVPEPSSLILLLIVVANTYLKQETREKRGAGQKRVKKGVGTILLTSHGNSPRLRSCLAPCD